MLLSQEQILNITKRYNYITGDNPPKVEIIRSTDQSEFQGYYEFGPHRIVLMSPSSEVLLHELGHACTVNPRMNTLSAETEAMIASVILAGRLEDNFPGIFHDQLNELFLIAQMPIIGSQKKRQRIYLKAARKALKRLIREGYIYRPNYNTSREEVTK